MPSPTLPRRRRPEPLPHTLQVRTSADIDEGATPTLRELTDTLVFAPGDGRIWLNDQRMLLWRASTYGSLRRELVARLGLEEARSLLTRVGYSAGARDAELVRRVWPGGDPANVFDAGPNLHKIEGFVRPETVAFEFDVARGDFYAEYLWHDSCEDDEHIAAFGIGTEPACWMQLGYASGYASAFMGKLVLFREVACRASGADACRIVGRPADQWADAALDQHYFQPDVSARQVGRRSVRPVPELGPGAAPAPSEPGELIGISSSFSAARHLIERVAPTAATVLFTGPSGAGKELFAQTLHRISPRAQAPFVALNCAAIPEALVESELFGVERGAFTGATVSRPGRFERAAGGTLFLDEIASLSFAAQGKLLRALQERRIERVGGVRELAVDVRVVAASNLDLRDEVAAGRFREDLYFRLNVFPIHLPPLKERRDDIPLLMEAFLRRYSAQHGRHPTGFTHRAVQALLQYDFPGNIRELQNLVERGVIMAEDDEPIDLHHLFRGGEAPALPLGLGGGGRLAEPPLVAPPPADHASARGAAPPPRGQHAKQETQRYRNALVASRYNVAEAARQLGLTRAQLAYRLKRLGLV